MNTATFRQHCVIIFPIGVLYFRFAFVEQEINLNLVCRRFQFIHVMSQIHFPYPL